MLTKKEIRAAWNLHYLQSLKKGDDFESVHHEVTDFSSELVQCELRPYIKALQATNQLLTTLLTDPSQKYQRRLIEAQITENQVLIKEMEVAGA